MYKHLKAWEHYYHIYGEQWINSQVRQSNAKDKHIKQVLSFESHEIFYSYDPDNMNTTDPFLSSEFVRIIFIVFFLMCGDKDKIWTLSPSFLYFPDQSDFAILLLPTSLF